MSDRPRALDELAAAAAAVEHARRSLAAAEAARDELIWQMRDDHTRTDLARVAGISNQRASQIILSRTEASDGAQP